MRHDERKGGQKPRIMKQEHDEQTCGSHSFFFFFPTVFQAVFLNNKMLIKACALARNGVQMDRGASSESEITERDK